MAIFNSELLQSTLCRHQNQSTNPILTTHGDHRNGITLGCSPLKYGYETQMSPSRCNRWSYTHQVAQIGFLGPEARSDVALDGTGTTRHGWGNAGKGWIDWSNVSLGHFVNIRSCFLWSMGRSWFSVKQVVDDSTSRFL